MRVVCVAVWRCVGGTCHLSTRFSGQVFVVIPVLASLCVTRIIGPAHPDIATNAYTTALLGDSTAQRSAFGQTRELLRAEDLQDFRFHLEAMSDMSLALGWEETRIFQLVVVFCTLELLVKAETQAEVTFVANRQVREDEVASWVWSVQVDHTSNRCAGKNSRLVRVWHASRLSQVPGGLQSGEKEVVGIHHEGDVFSNLFTICARLHLKHLELNDGWRINRSAIS